MRDPSHLVFAIPNILVRPVYEYRPALVEVWHRDPEKNGFDDSCGWRSMAQRRWWQHPKWHIWHWQIHVIPLRNLGRWLFDRCMHCGKRFAWAEWPVTDMDSESPRWFRSQPRIWHMRCSGK